MDTEKCRTFIAAAESRSFTEASEKLYMSTANVTKHIASLEKELGFFLFERHPHGIRLTKEGQTCLPYARQMLQAGEAMKRAGGEKLLVIDCVPCQYRIDLPRILGDFHRKYPNIQLQVNEYHGMQTLKRLLEGDCELSIMGLPYAKGHNLETRTLFVEPFCVVLPARHPLAKKTKISLRKLKNEDFVFLSPQSGMYQACVDMCRSCGFEPKVKMSVSREDTIFSYVENGDAITICGHTALICAFKRNVVMVDMEESFYTGVVLARRRNESLSASAQNFWNCFSDKN